MTGTEKAQYIDYFLKELSNASFASSLASIIELKQLPSPENKQKFKLLELELEKHNLVEFVKGRDNSTLGGQCFYFISAKGLDYVMKNKSTIELFNAENKKNTILEYDLDKNTMSINTKNRIFLCHASEDKTQVIEIYKNLKKIGFNPWLDKIDLLPGQEWDKEIRKVLKEAQSVIIFFSNNSVLKRGYVQKEFKLALDILQEIPEGQIFIIPTRLDDCQIPDSFKYIHYVDLFQKGGFDSIVKAIQHSFASKSEGIKNKFEIVNKEDGSAMKIFYPLPITHDNTIEIGLSACTNGEDKFIMATLRFKTVAQNILSNLTIHLYNGNSLTFELIENKLAYIGNSQITQGVFLVQEAQITKIKVSEIKTITIMLSDKLLRTYQTVANADILMSQFQLM